MVQYDILDSKDEANLSLLQRPELGVTLTKLHCWTLIAYQKAVFLDADALVVRNCDELFEQYEEFSAAPDIGWPDCFNSGVFVYAPSLSFYQKLLEFTRTNRSFDGKFHEPLHEVMLVIMLLFSRGRSRNSEHVLQQLAPWRYRNSLAIYLQHGGIHFVFIQTSFSVVSTESSLLRVAIKAGY